MKISKQSKTILCGFCSKSANKKDKNITEIHIDMIQVLIPDLKITDFNGLKISSKICNNCDNMLNDIFKFKSTCLELEDSVHNYKTEDSSQLDLEKLLGLDEDSHSNSRICRTCFGIIDNDLFVFIYENRNSLIYRHQQKCLSELDLSLTSKPVMCIDCVEKLQKYFNFASLCSAHLQTSSNEPKTENTPTTNFDFDENISTAHDNLNSSSLDHKIDQKSITADIYNFEYNQNRTENSTKPIVEEETIVIDDSDDDIQTSSYKMHLADKSTPSNTTDAQKSIENQNKQTMCLISNLRGSAQDDEFHIGSKDVQQVIKDEINEFQKIDEMTTDVRVSRPIEEVKIFSEKVDMSNSNDNKKDGRQNINSFVTDKNPGNTKSDNDVIQICIDSDEDNNKDETNNIKVNDKRRNIEDNIDKYMGKETNNNKLDFGAIKDEKSISSSIVKREKNISSLIQPVSDLKHKHQKLNHPLIDKVSNKNRMSKRKLENDYDDGYTPDFDPIVGKTSNREPPLNSSKYSYKKSCSYRTETKRGSLSHTLTCKKRPSENSSMDATVAHELNELRAKICNLERLHSNITQENKKQKLSSTITSDSQLNLNLVPGSSSFKQFTGPVLQLLLTQTNDQNSPFLVCLPSNNRINSSEKQKSVGLATNSQVAVSKNISTITVISDEEETLDGANFHPPNVPFNFVCMGQCSDSDTEQTETPQSDPLAVNTFPTEIIGADKKIEDGKVGTSNKTIKNDLNKLGLEEISKRKKSPDSIDSVIIDLENVLSKSKMTVQENKKKELFSNTMKEKQSKISRCEEKSETERKQVLPAKKSLLIDLLNSNGESNVSPAKRKPFSSSPLQNSPSKSINLQTILKLGKYTVLNNRMVDYYMLTVFKCEKCSFNTRSFHLIGLHISTHFNSFRQDGAYKCNKCNDKFPIKMELNKHFRVNHSINFYKLLFWCINCARSFPNENDVRRHHLSCIRKEISVKLFKCNSVVYCMFCNFETTVMAKANMHGAKCKERKINR